MKFYSVQIPYRGIIPILMRRGPIASIELTIEQVNVMLDAGVPLLDPTNGKTLSYLSFEENLSKPLFNAPVEAVEPQPVESVDPVVDPPIEVNEAVNTADDETDQKVSEDDTSDDTTDEADVEEEGSAQSFDFSKIANYSSLSKNKKKALRAQYAKLIASGTDVNIAYAMLNSEAKK